MEISPKDEALFRAVESGMVELVRAALKQGADVNVRNETGHTALMLACKTKNVDMVRLLLDQGSDITVTVRNSEGEEETALLYASILAGHGHISNNPVFDLLYERWKILWWKTRPIPLEKARLYLDAYSYTLGHAGFCLKNGELREGWFWVEPYADEITFLWAPSPMNSSLYDGNAEQPIPFEDIDLNSLYW